MRGGQVCVGPARARLPVWLTADEMLVVLEEHVRAVCAGPGPPPDQLLVTLADDQPPPQPPGPTVGVCSGCPQPAPTVIARCPSPRTSVY